jgi:hypothetical protein
LLIDSATAQELRRQKFRIELDGTFDEFVMSCRLIDGDVGRTIRRREFLPETYVILAEAVSCTVTMLDYRGRLSGRLYAEDGRLIASAEQNAIRPVVKLRSDGPWGAARGLRSAVPVTPATPRPRPQTRPAPRPGAPTTPPDTRPSIDPMRPPQ